MRSEANLGGSHGVQPPLVASDFVPDTATGMRTHSGGVLAHHKVTAGPAWGTLRGGGVKSEQAKPMCVQQHNARMERIPPDGGDKAAAEHS